MTCSIKTRMRITLDLYFFHFSDWPVDFMASKAGGGAASIAAASYGATRKLRRVTEPCCFASRFPGAFPQNPFFEKVRASVPRGNDSRLVKTPPGNSCRRSVVDH